jgi:hypothetical protein
MSQRIITVGAILTCFAIAASSARADSIRPCSSEVVSLEHFKSFCGQASNTIHDSSRFFASIFTLDSLESLSRRDDHEIRDFLARAGFGTHPDNETRVHGRVHIFDPQPYPRDPEVTASAIPTPEPDSLLLLSMGLMGITFAGVSFRRKLPPPPGTV